jgi:hypothetical protein
MANAKISDPAFNPVNDVTTIDGLAGYKGAGNVKISGANLVSSLEGNMKFPVDYMVCLNYAMPNLGYIGGDWNAPSGGSWIKNNTLLEKYDKTSTNNRITLKSLGNNTNFFFDLEISLSGHTANGGLYNWEVRMVDPGNPANVLTLMASAGVYPQIQTDKFENGAVNNWGYGWLSETTTTSTNIVQNFFDAFSVTEAEVITTVSTNNAGDDYANVGAWLRVRSE